MNLSPNPRLIEVFNVHSKRILNNITKAPEQMLPPPIFLFYILFHYLSVTDKNEVDDFDGG